MARMWSTLRPMRSLFDQAMPADELHRLIDHLRNFDVIPMISLGRDLHVVDSYHCMITLPDGSQKNIVKYEARCVRS